jgi:hypothetical protein
MRILRDFISDLDFVRMKPDKSFITAGAPPKTKVNALAEPGKQYAAYFFSGTNAAPNNLALTLNLPAGKYRAEWIDVLTGKTRKAESFKLSGTEAALAFPEYDGEVALRVVRR